MDRSFFRRNSWDNQCFQACFPHRRSDRHRHNHRDGCPEDSCTSKPKLPDPVCDNAGNESPKSSISIPVQCVGTSIFTDGQSMAKEAVDKAEAALKIQSAFRGFSVRKSAPLKNLNVILQVRAKMEEIRQRIQKPLVVNSVRQSQKERLIISEEIMSLFLALDAIQGVSSDLREARKSAIRDLVKLQEVVDAIIANKYADAGASVPAAEDSVTPSQPREPDAANVGGRFEESFPRADQRASMAEQKEYACNGPEDYVETRQNMPFLALSSESEIAEQAGNPNCRNDAGGVKGHSIENQRLRLGLPQGDSDPPWTEKGKTRDIGDETNCVDLSKKIDRISGLQAEQAPKGSMCLDQEPDGYSLTGEEGKMPPDGI